MRENQKAAILSTQNEDPHFHIFKAEILFFIYGFFI